MFTGIIEKTGKIVKIEQDRTNFDFTLEVDFAEELSIDQSMAHDGCCLTVVKLDKEKKQYVVTAMEETMFLGLREMKGVTRQHFRERFGVSMDEVYGRVLSNLAGLRLISDDGEAIRLTDRGISISNVVLAEFLLD